MKTPKMPDITKGVSEKERKRLSAALKEQSEISEKFSKSLQITGLFGMAFKYVDDPATFSLLVTEAKRIFGPVDSLGVPFEGAAVTPLGLMGLRGTPAGDVTALGRSYLNLLAPDRRKHAELPLGLLGRKAALSEIQALAPGGTPSSASLEGKVTILHFFQPDRDDVSLRHLVRLAAAHPEVSVVGITFFSSIFEDVARGLPERTGLAEQAESQLMLEAREVRKCSWPWFSAGRWKGVPTPVGAPDVRPKMFAHHHVTSVPTFIVVDRSSTIRYFHVGDDALISLDDAVAAALAEGRPPK
jgi:hypothetical protein